MSALEGRPEYAQAEPGSMAGGATLATSLGAPQARATRATSPGAPQARATRATSPGAPQARATRATSPGAPLTGATPDNTANIQSRQIRTPVWRDIRAGRMGCPS